jgi:hypothetical protein
LGYLLVDRQFDCIAGLSRVAIEDADGIGFEFDGEPFDFVVDALLAVSNLEGSAVFTGVELALNENMSPFKQPASYFFGEARSVEFDIVPLGLTFSTRRWVRPAKPCWWRR